MSQREEKWWARRDSRLRLRLGRGGPSVWGGGGGRPRDGLVGGRAGAPISV